MSLGNAKMRRGPPFFLKLFLPATLADVHGASTLSALKNTQKETCCGAAKKTHTPSDMNHLVRRGSAP